jgi:hypothetical protein
MRFQPNYDRTIKGKQFMKISLFPRYRGTSIRLTSQLNFKQPKHSPEYEESFSEREGLSTTYYLYGTLLMSSVYQTQESNKFGPEKHEHSLQFSI